MERMETSETVPSIYGNLIYNKTGIVDQCGKGWIEFSTQESQLHFCKPAATTGAKDCSHEVVKMDSHFTLYTKWEMVKPKVVNEQL